MTARNTTMALALALSLPGLPACGSKDYGSWHGYLAALEQKFEQTQSCTSLLEMPASMMDGRAYHAVPVEVGAGGAGTYVGTYYIGQSYTQFSVGATDDPPSQYPDCGQLYSWDLPDDPRPGAFQFDYSDSLDTMTPPPFFQGGSNADSGYPDYFGWATVWMGIDGPEGQGPAYLDNEEREESGGWSCVESIVGPPGTADGPAAWKGVAMTHVEVWTMPDGTKRWAGSRLPDDLGGYVLPMDVMVSLENVDCAISENANDDRSSSSWCYNWTEDCDGIDNDLDGVIDEGDGVDADGNGVADCMDDWDGDGIPNVDDPDVDDYDCYW